MKKLIILTISTLLSVSAYADSLSMAIAHKMDFLVARQGLISANIANSSTPEYLAKDINFKPASSRGSLRMNVTSSNHIAISSNNIGKFEQTEDKTFIRNDGNSVRVDEQMLKLADIQQQYNLATKLYSKHMALQKLAVQAK